MAPVLEVADVFRRHGEAFRQARDGHLGYVERRVMGAITACRTAALGGHVEQCDNCGATRIAYNSCLMGKFRNGELDHGRIGLSVDSADFTLHYEQGLDRTLSFSRGQKGSFCESAEQGP
jgi:hypothetical protein